MLNRLRTNLIVLVVICGSALSAAAEPSQSKLDDFERFIRPVLVAHCYECHSADSDQPMASLRLDVPLGWLRGGDSGPAVVPGDPEGSLLMKAIRYQDEAEPMPPDEKLTDEVIRRFADWIRDGAVAPKNLTTSASDEGVAPSSQSTDDELPKTTSHWAFIAPQSAVLSKRTSEAEQEGRRLDRILAKYQATVSLTRATMASPETQIRRLYVDLTGLPPRYAEVQSFLNESAPDAYQRIVERLLASPRFGERWARYWLDVARFSDTKGYVFTSDRNYPDAHKYRDWVIDALNNDRPIDEFIRYQLAADQLAPDHPEELAAMGFLTLGRRFLNNRHDIIDDRIDVTTRGLMGLTVSCARCHDHKYDPIPTEDYYSLYGVFASSDEPGDAPSPLRLVDKDKPIEPVVFLRGQPGRRGPTVPRRFPAIVSGPNREPFRYGSGRLEMAQAIGCDENVLTARVFVNRVWGKLFGGYLVDTPSDFGTRCSRPPLAELLDDLAVEFMRHDWSLKWLVRELVLSTTYRSSSLTCEHDIQVDVENRWYARMNRRRLDFEAMRDSLLLVSGQLDDRAIGGESVEITGTDPVPRRSLYATIDRQNFPSLFRAFDVASPDTHAPKRFETTVPQQALFLMNSPFATSCARRIARMVTQADESDELRVRRVYRQILSRDPDNWEQNAGLRFIAETTEVHDAMTAWMQLSQVLLVSNEFFVLD